MHAEPDHTDGDIEPVHVLEMEPFGRSTRAIRIRFSDGSARVTSRAAVRELGLDVDMRVSYETLDRQLAKIEPRLARDRSLRLLGYREYSRSELSQRVQDEGYAAPIVSEVVRSLEAVGLVDDARFAQYWARSRVAQCRGRHGIELDLASRGIEPRVIAEVLDEHCPIEGELTRARAIVGLGPRTHKEREKALRMLLSRGFSAGVAVDALRGPDDFSGEDLPE